MNLVDYYINFIHFLLNSTQSNFRSWYNWTELSSFKSGFDEWELLNEVTTYEKAYQMANAWYYSASLNDGLSCLFQQ